MITNDYCVFSSMKKLITQTDWKSMYKHSLWLKKNPELKNQFATTTPLFKLHLRIKNQ
ncbi:MAG: hypothetical protein KGD74_00100 [Candidatus Lokiarchaeota archaeon]|nr:hypothetical protein [Candidatus Lokiarchaeota archaeon]